MIEDRLARLEKSMNRLIAMGVSVIVLAAGGALLAAAPHRAGISNAHCIGSPAGAPEGGFVVVPGPVTWNIVFGDGNIKELHLLVPKDQSD